MLHTCSTTIYQQSFGIIEFTARHRFALVATSWSWLSGCRREEGLWLRLYCAVDAHAYRIPYLKLQRLKHSLNLDNTVASVFDQQAILPLLVAVVWLLEDALDLAKSARRICPGQTIGKYLIDARPFRKRVLIEPLAWEHASLLMKQRLSGNLGLQSIEMGMNAALYLHEASNSVFLVDSRRSRRL